MMNKWKIAFILATVLLVLSNAFWLIVSIDAGYSYSYLLDSYNEQTGKVHNLGSLVAQGSERYSNVDLMHLLRQAKPGAFIVDQVDSINFEGIEFRFENGLLVEVRKLH